MREESIEGHQEGCAKPDPRFYAIVCERLGVTAAETLFLDDVAANVDVARVDAARAVGITAILLTDNRQAIAALEHVLGGGR